MFSSSSPKKNSITLLDEYEKTEPGSSTTQSDEDDLSKFDDLYYPGYPYSRNNSPFTTGRHSRSRRENSVRPRKDRQQSNRSQKAPIFVSRERLKSKTTCHSIEGHRYGVSSIRKTLSCTLSSPACSHWVQVPWQRQIYSGCKRCELYYAGDQSPV